MVIHIQPTNPSVSSVSVLCVSKFCGSGNTDCLPVLHRQQCVPEAWLWSGLVWPGTEKRQCLAPDRALLSPSLWSSASACCTHPPVIITVERTPYYRSIRGMLGCFHVTQQRAGQIGKVCSGAWERTCACMWAGISDSLHESGSKHHFHPRQLPWKS